jgi:hypothetical protein
LITRYVPLRKAAQLLARAAICGSTGASAVVPAATAVLKPASVVCDAASAACNWSSARSRAFPVEPPFAATSASWIGSIPVRSTLPVKAVSVTAIA